MPTQSRPRRLAVAALVLSAAVALAGCTGQDEPADSAAQAQERADALRSELTSFVLPGGEQSLEPSALTDVDAGDGYHAETLFTGRAADGASVVAEAATALESAGLQRVTELPDGNQVPADAGVLSTGYWGGGDWIVGAQAGERLGDDGARTGDLVLRYVFLTVGGGEPAAEG